MLPSTICTVSAPGIGNFRGSMAGLCAPLSTLRQYPHGYLRMTRGRCGSLLLHRDGLAPSTPCRSPGALRSTPVNGHSQDRRACLKGARTGPPFGVRYFDSNLHCDSRASHSDLLIDPFAEQHVWLRLADRMVV